MLSCLICDDHALVREALAGTVRMCWPEAEITEVGNFPAAWTAAASGPDLCIADLMMPGAVPLLGIEGIITASPATRILIVTGTEDDELMLDLLDMGVAGFATKTSSGGIIEAAMRLIMAGGRYLPPRMADIAASRIDTGAATVVRDKGVAVVDHLTDRQMAVLRLMAEGRSTKDIARVLNIAPSTVKTHLAQVMSVLNAGNRTEASRLARELKLV